MLTLITGVPGAGKTLYGIQELLLPIVGTSVKVRTDDGLEVEHPRTIYTNIKGLQVEHDLCDHGAVWEHTKEGWRQVADGNRLGFHNWHQWAKPGAVFLIDEFQRLWPPRPNGAPVPPDVQALDTHRHMGVDFILITQNGNNVDRHVIGLIGRHLHVRRIANMPLAIVYEWDHASRSLMFSKSISKKPWKYKRATYKLYHSADLHTKQPRSVPPLLFVVVAAIAAGVYFVPNAYSRIAGKGDEHQARMSSMEKKPAQERASAAPHAPAPAASSPVAPASSAIVPLAAARQTHLGCIAFRDRCECFNGEGTRMPVEPAMCLEGSHRTGYVMPAAPLASVPPGTSTPATPLPATPVPPSSVSGDQPRTAAAAPLPGSAPAAGMSSGAQAKATAS